MRRWIVAAALVASAVMVAPRLRVEYASHVTVPELGVALSLPESAASDPADTVARWVVPIESAIRSLGDVAATRGEVAANFARLTVRFRGDVDPELKTARLLADLAPLRAKLPADARIEVWPATQGSTRPDALIALRGKDAERAVRRVAEEMRGAEGVRDAVVYGGVSEETTVRLLDDAPFTADAVRDAIHDALATRSVGQASRGARVLPVIVPRTATRVADVRVTSGSALLPLSSIADVRTSMRPQLRASRLDGEPAVVIGILRDDAASPFRVERALHARMAELTRDGLSFEELTSDAADLRALLEVLAAGALLAMLILAIACGASGAAYVPLSLAIAMNAAWLCGIEVDAAAIIAAVIAIAGLAPLLAMRRRTAVAAIAVLAVVLVPVDVLLGSRALVPFLIAPARAFAIAGIAAALASLLLPRANVLATRGATVRVLLRNAATVILAITTASFTLVAWCGSSLDPRAAADSADRGRLYARLQLPAGSTLAQTVQAVTVVEKAAKRFREIRRTWSVVDAGSATTTMELATRAQTPEAVELLRMQLGDAINLPPGALTIREQFDRSAARMSDDIEEQPEADATGRVYRFIIRGTNLDAVRRTADLIDLRLRRDGVQNRFDAEWGAPSSRVELEPLPATSPADASALARALVERTVPPPRVELSDGRTLSVASRRAPLRFDDVPRDSDLFATPLPDAHPVGTVLSAFRPRRAFILGSAQRELGRFVLPVTVRVAGSDEEQLLAHREDVDRTIRTMSLPAGVAIARPPLTKWHASLATWRAVATAALLPLLLFAAAAIALNSVARGFAALLPAGASVALTSGVFFATFATVDEPALFALGAAAACVTAVAICAFRATTNVEAYRMLRGIAVPSVAASLVALAFLVPASFLSAASRGGWRSSLVGAAAVLATGSVFAPLAAASLVVVSRDVRRRATREGRALRRPAAWSVPDAPNVLAVQSVTKMYGGGFRALRHVSFELQPGVVGLLGPNGAGKTTMLRILTGLLLPTRGDVLFRGVSVVPENLADYRRSVGFLPQEFNAWPTFTAEEFLEFWAIERGMVERGERAATIARVLEEVGLTDAANRRVRDFSGGMRQRIGIARALLGDPAIIIADEPTTGLDIEARARFRDLMRAIARNRIVILSTHIAGDVEATASRILLLDKGSLRYDGTPEALVVRARGRVFEDVVSETDARALSRRYRVTTRVRVRGGIRVRGVVPPGEELPASAAEPTLEEAYLADIAARRQMKVSAFAFLSEGTVAARPRQDSNLRPTA